MVGAIDVVERLQKFCMGRGPELSFGVVRRQVWRAGGDISGVGPKKNQNSLTQLGRFCEWRNSGSNFSITAQLVSSILYGGFT